MTLPDLDLIVGERAQAGVGAAGVQVGGVLDGVGPGQELGAQYLVHSCGVRGS